MIEYTANIFIKNAIIGLSSSFGIFCINNNEPRLSNIIVNDFQTYWIF